MVLTNETQKVKLREFSDDEIAYFARVKGTSIPDSSETRKEAIKEQKEKLKLVQESSISKPKMTILQVIEDLGVLKEKFVNKELKEDEDITSLANIDNTNLLYETYWETNPKSIFYRLSGLTRHEGSGTQTSFISYISFFVLNGYALGKGEITEESIVKAIDASTNFYKIVEKVLKDEDTKISINEFINTFVKKDSSSDETREFDLAILSYGDKKVIFEEGWTDFDSFEEFISVRTLIHNALKESDVSEVRISKSQDPATSKNVYTIVDNGPKSEKFLDLAKRAKESYEDGKKYSNFPGLISTGGAKLVPFLAGQRSDEFFINDDPNGPKMIQITFSRPKS